MYRMQLTLSSALGGSQYVFVYKTEQGERSAATSSPPTSARPDDDIFAMTFLALDQSRPRLEERHATNYLEWHLSGNPFPSHRGRPIAYHWLRR